MSEEQSKKVEMPLPSQQPKPKKQHSYTYWVDDKNKSRQLPLQQRPQKVQVVPQQLKKQQSGRSQWNNSGTWQQRKVSLAEIQKEITMEITKFLEIQKNPKSLKKVSLDGQFQIIFTRNKKGLMYDLNGKIQFQSEKDLYLKIVEINDQGDKQFKIKAQLQQEKQWINKQAKHLIQIVDEVLNKYKN